MKNVDEKVFVGLTIGACLLALLFTIIVLDDWTPNLENTKDRFVLKDQNNETKCDSQVVLQELIGRNRYLRKSKLDWKSSNPDSLTIQVVQYPERPCVKGLRYRVVSGDPAFGYIHEREIYSSGTELLVFDSDVPGGTKDTVCEEVLIDFRYCDPETQYLFYSGKPYEEYSDGVFSKTINRFVADSILLSWGIKREFPPEDFEWLYREEQLKRAMAKAQKIQ